MKRASGILLPVFSLPSAYGIGCFSKEAYDFIDWLKEAGQSYWQILPLGPTSYGDSPYQSFSSYAGNPYFIDLEKLIEEGLLTKEECDACDFGSNESYIEYGLLYQERYKLLRTAYERSEIYKNTDFQKFCESNAYWLDDYALFMAVKAVFGGNGWSEWPEDIKKRWGYSMDYYRREYYYDIEFYKFLQYEFNKQWSALKAYANKQGIEIIGDIPIYVAFDSADAWAHPEMFQFDENMVPKAVAGCPPDAFSATGQLWGNPLYDWNKHRETGFDWWIARLAHCFTMYDVVRIDHFRGFDQYFSIPYGDETAQNGHWEYGPGMDLFNTIRYRLGEKQIIAEDLGLMTDSVRKLVKDSGLPNMKVLEFAFEPDGSETEYLPHTYDKNCVVYTGTHDNETLVQWYNGLDKDTSAFAERYMHNGRTAKKRRYQDFIRMAMMSCANTCIIPLQDYLGLDAEARINFPSTLGTNWKWRMKKDMCTEEVRSNIFELTDISFRLPAKVRAEITKQKKTVEETEK